MFKNNWNIASCVSFKCSVNVTNVILGTSGGPTAQWLVTESNGARFFYTNNTLAHTRITAGYMSITLLNTQAIAPYVTSIEASSHGIDAQLGQLLLSRFKNLTYLSVHSNSNLGGSLIRYSMPSGLLFFFASGCSLSGGINGLVIPTAMQQLYLAFNQLTGDLSTTSVPTAMRYLILNNNQFSAMPVFGASSNLRQYDARNNNLSQSAIDSIISNIYTNRAGFTYATPVIDIDGANAAPSGVYQLTNPPVTGKEKIYWLVNDPLSEGFNKQTWTYTP